MEKPWLVHYEDGVPSHIDYPDAPLSQFLDDSAARYGSQPAVKMVLRYLPAGLIVGAEMTYGELKDKVDRLATALYELGVRKGPPVVRETR